MLQGAQCTSSVWSTLLLLQLLPALCILLPDLPTLVVFLLPDWHGCLQLINGPMACLQEGQHAESRFHDSAAELQVRLGPQLIPLSPAHLKGLFPVRR